MNAWVIMGIFENLNNSDHPVKEALQDLSESGNKETPNDKWEELPQLANKEHLHSLAEWVRTIYMEAAQIENVRSVFFLLEEEYIDGSVVRDIHVYLSEVEHTSHSYEEWSKGESLGKSQNQAFSAISEAVDKFEDINGMSDYAIPLLYSGAAVYDATICVCKDPSFKLKKDLTIAVGYVYGDCFQLGKIVKPFLKSTMSFKLNIDRLA